MKYNLPYLVNIPPFLLKDLDQGDLRGIKKLLLILKGKFISIIINKTNGKVFCFLINLFFRRNGKIYYENKKYFKTTKDSQYVYFPNKRILRIVKNISTHLDRMYLSYCIDKVEIKNGDIVVDCGANIGELNLALKYKNIIANYYGFEPDLETFECLLLNHSDFKNNLFNVALSDVSGQGELYIDNEGGNSSLINFGSEKVKKVKLEKLDNIQIEGNIKLLKVEAEGNEPEVLVGAEHTLTKTEYVTVDFGGERGVNQEMTLIDVNNFLYSKGFELINFSDFRIIGLTKTKTYKLKNFNYLIQEVDSKTEGFLLELKKQNDTFNFFPALEGLTSAGKNLNLGFSCYALKIFFILGLWEKLDSESKKSWKNYISDFQINKKNPSENLFIDTSYLSYYQRLSLNKLLKNTSKKILNLAGVGRYITDEEKLKNSLRAETKQAISTLNQINEKSKFEFFEFNNNTLELESYLNSLDWSKPWSAGGQFSALCLFSKINNSKEGINLLRNFSSELVDKHTGFYFKGDLPNST